MSKKSNFTKDDLIKELISQNIKIDKLNKIYDNLDIDLNSLYIKDEPILHSCCKKDLYEAVCWLLEHNINTEIETVQKETAVFYAIYSKNSRILKALLDFKANINHLNNNNRTALQESINSSNNQIIRYLLQITKTLNNRDSEGNTLLFDAVINGNLNLIKSIIDLKKVDINEVNNDGNTILHLKNALNSNELAILLLEAGANPTIPDRNGKSFLALCVANGIENINIIKKAALLGFDLNIKNRENKNILMEAVNNFLQIPKDDKKARDNQAELIKELVQMDINIQTVDNDNETVFFNITRSEDRDLIHYFLNNGLNINLDKQNNSGLTVLTLLVLKGVDNSDLIKLFVEKGASLNAKNKFGKTIIEILIDIVLYQENSIELEEPYKSLLNNNAQYKDILELFANNYNIAINELNSKGEPLFFSSILNLNFSLFKILLTKNIDLNKKDRDGNNIIFRLLYLYNENKIEIYLNTIKNLITIGVDINESTQNGTTALQLSIVNDCKECVSLILELGASCSLVDEKGRNLIHTCIFKDKTDYIKYIHQYNSEIINEPDSFGVRPINYIAFMGKRELVLDMLKMGALIENPCKKSPNILSFLEKYHKNILNISFGIQDEEDKAKLNLLSQNMIKEFNINQENI